VINDRKDDVARQEVVNVPPTNALLRFGKPDDVARVLAFLLSDESDWITGQIINTGGGTFRD
jgi:3-oxoacyl-[acyl-carrier protein] reductase